MKSAQDYLDDANKVIKRMTAEEAISHHKADNTVFIDVRDSADIAETGSIEGALSIPRGMIEFRADETHNLFQTELKKDAQIFLVCGAGGQAALAGKTLIEMGFQNVTNIGGVGDWKAAGGPMDHK